MKKLRGLVKFSEKLEDAIQCYTQLCVTESDYHSFQCQVKTLCRNTGKPFLQGSPRTLFLLSSRMCLLEDA
ncbi:unnamed protein product [Haemonchus placei]|uniref:TPR_REGION domain-containing protein n=1 Tax=Haemonchus placei TaxID=6290 RepID=A0A0N4WQW5_HAEPC|nr:unnamed protein product [Haemonchus placei]